MKYTVRIKNDMFGYERDQIMQVEADSEAEAIEAGRKIDRFASITAQKQEEPTMDYDEIDCLVVKELKEIARMLADTVLLEDLDYDDSLSTLKATLEVISYYSTADEYVNFINTLPDGVFDALMPDRQNTYFEYNDVGMDVVTASDSVLSQNLKNLGYKTYMAMAELGFISFEDMVNAAKLQLQRNGSKHN
jgi:hypothetical protein